MYGIGAQPFAKQTLTPLPYKWGRILGSYNFCEMRVNPSRHDSSCTPCPAEMKYLTLKCEEATAPLHLPYSSPRGPLQNPTAPLQLPYSSLYLSQGRRALKEGTEPVQARKRLQGDRIDVLDLIFSSASGHK